MPDDILDRLTNRSQLEQRLKKEGGAAALPAGAPLAARFFGGGAEAARKAGQPVANGERKNPPALGVLFPVPPSLASEALTRTLRSYHPSLGKAVFEIERNGDSGFLGLAGWGDHAVRVFGVNAPMPSQTVEAVVQPAHYAQELKQQARAHRAHALLFSAGTITDPLEEYVALAVVAGVLAKHGAIIVTNEEARTSRPADTLIAGRYPGDSLALLRALPLLVLYCGLVKYGVEGTEGVWMRTYGVHRFGMPDLASLMAGHHQGQHYFTMFQNIYAYLRQTGAKFAAGHTANIGNDFIRLREPAEAEYFLQSPGGLFVVEPVSVQ